MGPSEKSGDEEHVSDAWDSAGNHLKWEWWSYRSNHGQVWTPQSSTDMLQRV